MSRYTVLKFKLLPKPRQKRFLDNMFKEASIIWNIILIHSITDDREAKLFKTKHLNAQLKQNLVRRFCHLLRSQKKLKELGKSGKIGFKPCNVLSAWSMQPIRFKNNKVKIGKLKSLIYVRGIKQIHQLQKRNIKYKFVATQLLRRTNGYYLHVITEIDEPIQSPDSVLGIDFGIKHQLTLSNRVQLSYDNSRLLTKPLARIKRLQKALSRKTKGSRAFRRLKFLIRKTWERYNFKQISIINTIYHILRQYKLAFQKELIHKWHQSEFKSIRCKVQKTFMYKIKSKLALCTDHIEINSSKPTTKTCSRCGYIKDETPLSTRTYKCNRCNLTIDRDLNSAWNMLRCIGYTFNQINELSHIKLSESDIDMLTKHDIRISTI